MDNGRASLLAALENGGWPSTAADDLARAAHLVSFEKDSTIFHAGEAADLVYIVIEGQAKLRYDASAGRSVLVAIAHPGQMLGVVEPAWTVGQSREGQFFTAQAWPFCRVAIIPTARILRSLRKLAPEQIVRVLERRREEWTRLCCRLLEYLTMSVRSRLTHALGEVADHFGVADDRGRLIDLRLSHEDLAALVGASRPMVSKHLKELESEGTLARENGRFRLLSAPPAPAKEEARA